MRGGEIRAPDALLPTYGFSEDSARPHIEVSADGAMHWVVCERGVEQDRRRTHDPDELLYWIFESVTFSMACDFEVSHRIANEDFRRQLFAHQLGLLGTLHAGWRERRIEALGERATVFVDINVD